MNNISCHYFVMFVAMMLMSIDIFAQEPDFNKNRLDDVSSVSVVVYEKFKDFDDAILKSRDNEITYVVNFWATWCGPCVKELPYFEQLNDKYSNAAFKQILVSLDSPKQLDSKVIPFVVKNSLKSEVVLLADGKYNDWIDLIDPSWSGAIPITLILKGDKKLFYEREFHSMKEIEDELLKLF